MTLIPVRGTDYYSKAEVHAAWDRGATFQLATSAHTINKKDCAEKDVYIKFNNLTDITVVSG